MTTKIARYHKLLESIPCHPKEITTTRLRQILEEHMLFNDNDNEKSNTRTIQGLLKEIVNMHSDVEVVELPQGNVYKIREGQAHPFCVDNFSSTLVLQLIEEHIQTMLPPTLHKETIGLFNQVNNKKNIRYDLWKKHFCFASTEFQLVPSLIDSDMFSKIEDAIQRDRDLTIEYMPNRERQLKQYHLTPKGIVLNGSDTYVVGYSHTSGGYRNFAFHRINSIDSHFRTPGSYQNDQFCLRTYVENDRLFGGDEVELTLKINRANGFHFLQNKQIGENQRIIEEHDEHVIIKVKVRNSFDLSRWLTKHADVIQVLAPESIRRRVVYSLNSALKQYEELEAV
ncbi:WYL domain-containing protein [Vibrio astriarenae]|uniref:WYL domain-containing protein n=1 Tax=Vibrio astriarenae TaxID=1481923 RepID=A0A7Z2YFD8_9VIBR|nr:WYL domain-containing protein [Vibrio astriarenae]QIA65402.1 WYL domain-containing protein [Vibrio astriarenae]